MCHCLKLSSDTTGICSRQQILVSSIGYGRYLIACRESIHDTFTDHWSANLKHSETSSVKKPINTIWVRGLQCTKMLITVRSNYIIYPTMGVHVKHVQIYLSQTTVQHFFRAQCFPTLWHIECMLASVYFLLGLQPVFRPVCYFFNFWSVCPFFILENILLFNDFQWPTLLFHDFSGLENVIIISGLSRPYEPC